MKRSLEQADIFQKDSEKPGNNNTTSAANVRGMFMNEHISREEYLQREEKKRKMKEVLEYHWFFSVIN